LLQLYKLPNTRVSNNFLTNQAIKGSCVGFQLGIISSRKCLTQTAYIPLTLATP